MLDQRENKHEKLRSCKAMLVQSPFSNLRGKNSNLRSKNIS